MAKIALLIGVSEYEQDLVPLATPLNDVAAMQRVLSNQDLGEFDTVDTLLNPDAQSMQERIETLLAERSRDDLILLYFSGHGLKDDNGKLYFGTSLTRKTNRGDLLKSTAVPASFIHEVMASSRSRRQVVILDCCFSGAFGQGLVAKDDGSVNIKEQLGGEGRAVLTSSSSTQYSFEQLEKNISPYTSYLVEGIETGAADQDADGVISIAELHEYASKRVREELPAMKPEIYVSREGFNIYIAKAPVAGDSKLKYRQEAERFINQGRISSIGRTTLDTLRTRLGLSVEEASSIESEILEVYRTYKDNLQRYREVLTEAIQHQPVFSEDTRRELQRFQQVLGLSDEDTRVIEASLLEEMKSSQQTPQEGLLEENTKELTFRVGSLGGAGNDWVADKDQLGFKHYVTAFADLIESSHTKPPLTIGIFGSWGMGKSFLLDHIARTLNQRYEERRIQGRKRSHPPLPRVHIVEFNAWEYSCSEVIWPGLVRKIMNRLEKEVSWGFPGQFLIKFGRNLKHQFQQSRSQVIAIVAALVGLIVFSLWKFKLDLTLIWSASVALGVGGLFKLIADTASKPLSQWITNTFQISNYGKHIGYMAEIRADLEFLATRLKKDNGRILVIIDDLDRCEPQKAVEVLQAIKLLLNFDSFIVCLGIDARIITRAVEEHYKNMLGPAGASGYEYLDKIVQIPFRIPEPNTQEIELFIARQLFPDEEYEPKSPVSDESQGIVEQSSLAIVSNSNNANLFSDNNHSRIDEGMT